jgi:hypothetical protein
MISSNSTEETVSFFLKSMKDRFPAVDPEYFISDKDQAQLNSIECHYPMAMIYLCWWHVLHAWRSHFSTSEFPELWEKLKKWIRIADEAEFWDEWKTIRAIAPVSVVEYFETHWIPNVKQWSAVHWVGRTIFQDSDTNMLVEAWHHLLKGKFMQGKRNHRLDQLIHILVKQVIPHFIQKHHSQTHGFEGGDLEVRESKNSLRRSASATSQGLLGVKMELYLMFALRPTPISHIKLIWRPMTVPVLRSERS